VREIPSNEKLVRRIDWVSGSLLVIFTSGAWVLYSLPTAKGVFLGCLIAMLSF